MKELLQNNIKNCKNVYNYNKNRLKLVKNDKKYKNIQNLDFVDLQLLAWIKTVICVREKLPNIIKLIDKVVLAKSSSAGSGSLIFGDHKNGTYGQVEEVLKLQDRKVSLINLYALVEDLTSCLKPEQKKFIELKYYKRRTALAVAEELNIDERSVYRWANSILLKLLVFAKQNNWSSEFFCNQLQNEGWLYEHYEKHLKVLSSK